MKDEHPELWQAYWASRSDRDRNALVAAYSWIPRRVAGKLHAKLPPHISFDDSVQNGQFGLIEAIEVYHPDGHPDFPSFAKHYVKGRMIDALRDTDYFSRRTRAQVERLRNARQEFMQENGAWPGDEELQQRSGFSDSEFRTAARLDRKVWEFSQLEDALDRQNVQDFGAEEEGYAAFEFKDWFNHIFSGCSAKEKLLLQLYYVKGYTLLEVGKVVGITESGMSWVNKNLLDRLRKAPYANTT